MECGEPTFEDGATLYEQEVGAEDELPSFVNDDPNDNDSVGGEEEMGEDEGGIEGRMSMHLMHGSVYKTESDKRRERRHAQAAREREGQRRQKERKRCNFLSVDEHTMKPYGVGVGDWRKELMLLSRNLDLAIGNIKNQPEAALFELADWIQQMWEYSSPIKFSYVKEVIA